MSEKYLQKTEEFKKGGLVILATDVTDEEIRLAGLDIEPNIIYRIKRLVEDKSGYTAHLVPRNNPNSKEEGVTVEFLQKRFRVTQGGKTD